MDPGKLDLARRLYVFDTKPLVEICLLLDISMLVLDQYCSEEGWEAQRAEATAKRKADAGDALAEHRHLSMKHLRWMDVLLSKQADPDLTPADRKALRGMMETAQAASLALSLAVETDRKIHGVRNTAPSVPKDAEEVQGVRYFVGVPPEAPSGVEAH